MKIIVHVFFYATNINEKIFMEKNNYYIQHELDASSSARQNLKQKNKNKNDSNNKTCERTRKETGKEARCI